MPCTLLLCFGVELRLSRTPKILILARIAEGTEREGRGINASGGAF